MAGMNDGFKMQRRNSLSQEVDGIWSQMEEEEDTIIPHKVSVNECNMLRRVLGGEKMEILPKSCKMMTTAGNRTFMTRLAHFADTPDIAGNVSLNECKQLHGALKGAPGGATFLPMSCTALIKHDEELEKDRMEQQNAKVYQRLKRRQTFVAQQDYPPTAC